MLVAAQVALRAARAERHPGLAGADRAHARGVGGTPRRPGTRTARSPRRRRPPAPTARRRAARATSATPGASGSASRSIAIATPLRRARWRASVARPSERSIIALAPSGGQGAPLGQARLGPQVGAHEARRRRARGRRARPGPAAAAPSAPVTTTPSPGRAPSRPTSSSLVSAQPVTVTASVSDGRAHEVAARDGRRRALGQRLHRAHAVEHRVGPEAVGHAHGHVRLAGVGAHRGEVRQRGGQRAVAGVGRGDPGMVEAEVHAVDHRVDRGDRERAARARRRRRRRPSARCAPSAAAAAPRTPR